MDYRLAKSALRIFCISTLLIISSIDIAEASQNLDANGYSLYPTPNYKSGFPAALIKQGEYLVKAGDCIACHTDTEHDGFPFAGGFAIKTPFGTFFTPNITPDKNTGIGAWTSAQFIHAMQRGISPEGSNYFPAFPYTSFTRVNNEDLVAIQAYIMSIPAINKESPKNDISWPFSIRFLQWGWKFLFFRTHQGVYINDNSQTAQWNRGAYLVQGLGHCGECHSPRNIFGAVKHENELTGAFVEGYFAPDISAQGLKNASIDDIVNVFVTGKMLNGAGKVQGPMAEVNYDSLRYLSQNDLRAIALYLKTIKSSEPAPISTPSINAGTGKTIYAEKCDVCHGSGAAGAPKLGDTLAWTPRIDQGMSVLYQHAIDGYNSMPPKGTCMSCSDDEIKAAVNYLIDSSKNGTGSQSKSTVPQMPKLTLAEGKALYLQNCSVCHEKGLLGAPRLGDKNAWDPLIKQNMDVLYKHAIYGYNRMPAKGTCITCSDAQIEAAVKYMVQETYPESNYSLW